ncbi:hypothetical protein HAX54_023722 [Datura stramonium]|uniref:Uncharacterized protein n=1 Tax=Datura stramonium TaxID=4076 RepID=A0ABS8Y5K2_DATST|nr:hypothetical protein [Datura stramonium]
MLPLGRRSGCAFMTNLIVDFIQWKYPRRPLVHLSGVGFDEVANIGLTDLVTVEIIPHISLTTSMLRQTIPSSMNHLMQGVKEEPQVPRIEEGIMEAKPIEEDPEEDSKYDPDIYDPSDGDKPR